MLLIKKKESYIDKSGFIVTNLYFTSIECDDSMNIINYCNNVNEKDYIIDNGVNVKDEERVYCNDVNLIASAKRHYIVVNNDMHAYYLDSSIDFSRHSGHDVDYILLPYVADYFNSKLFAGEHETKYGALINIEI